MAMHIDEKNFNEEVKGASVPVLVDFWASWCGPCRTVAPAVDAISKEYEGRIKVGKVNVDESPDLAAKYGIMSIPTFIIFQQGEVADAFAGALPKSEIVERLRPFLN